MKKLYEDHIPYYQHKNFPVIYHKDFISPSVNFTKVPWDAKVVNYRTTRTHFHEGIELLHIFDGNVNVHIGNKTYTASAGDIIVINSGVLHRLSSDNTACNYSCLILNCELCKSWGFDIEQNFFESVINDNLITGVFADIENEFQREDRFYQPMVYSHCIKLLALLSRNYRSLKDIDSAEDKKTALVRNIVSYINQNYAESISLEGLSERFGYNKFYLSHLFTAGVGISIMEHLMRIRIHNAQKFLMQGNLSMPEIAENCGFANASVLSMHFKKVAGCSPTQYRKSRMQK